MSVRACCCSGSPCTGNNCCTACSGENCCVVERDNYTINVGTVHCDCWTWGEYVVDAPGWKWCSPSGQLFCTNSGCPDDAIQINDCPSQFELVKGQCEAGKFQQHHVYTCIQPGDCSDYQRGDNTWDWPVGSVTATFQMDLVENPLDPSGNCCIALPDELGVVSYEGFTGATNASAQNAIICWPYPGYGPLDPPPNNQTPPYDAAVMVSASFCACRNHPCATWQPNDFQVLEMCAPCTGKWDVVTVAYFIRNEHQTSGSADANGLCQDPSAGCWTYDTWAALVRYVRQPSCEEGQSRSIVGTYTFACAEVSLPITSVFYSAGNAGTVHQGGQGRRLAYWSSDPPTPCCENFCVWGLPDPICPSAFFVSQNKGKICAPETSGYGWTFPQTITIT